VEQLLNNTPAHALDDLRQAMLDSHSTRTSSCS
jgi:hypothetical protein